MTQRKRQTAREVLTDLLRSDGQWHPSRAIIEEAEVKGCNARTTQRAMRELDIEHRRAHSYHAPTEWRWQR
jgi:hypothetical protein